MISITLLVAFTAGVISFLSPCVLPLIPGYLAYLAGASVGNATTKRKEIFINSIFFVIGFSLVFAILGILLNTVLSHIAASIQMWLARLGGVLIISFGLYLVGLLKIPWLEREFHFTIRHKFSSKYLTSLLFGAAFAAGWSPCVGAVLGSILGLAASQPSLAFWLLLIYSFGLGAPFLIVGLFTAQATKLIDRYSKWVTPITTIFGFILIGLGILVFTDNLSLIANFDILNQWLLQ